MQGKEARHWMSIAKADLAVAKHLDNTFYPKPLEIICYHCQQAAEKAVKAIIVLYDAPGGVPRKHDISFLLNQIKDKITVEENLCDYADALTPYGVEIRYPSELFIEERDEKEAIQFAEEIVSWVEKIVLNNLEG